MSITSAKHCSHLIITISSHLVLLERANHFFRSRHAATISSSFIEVLYRIQEWQPFNHYHYHYHHHYHQRSPCSALRAIPFLPFSCLPFRNPFMPSFFMSSFHVHICLQTAVDAVVPSPFTLRHTVVADRDTPHQKKKKTQTNKRKPN